MEEESNIHNDPSFRLGTLVGRLQAVRDMMALFAMGEAADDDLDGQMKDIVRRQAAIALWLEQAQTECDARWERLLSELREQEGEDGA
ncbi:hypothetical protein [Brevundimonas sp. P7753]|jgi:hypothetical protein|uniref:hypothetical protein n=1 Tax=Brevundimonas sp. P7753 TaxID=2726982 RepID=UPI0015BD8DE8|nr:hypothetical protein [Brevundimonas sp. P7753]NWE51872.1 hypothetical protein [Brevundimonas sp. P7753]